MFNSYYTELYEERAAIYEFDARMSREDAEMLAYHDTVVEFIADTKVKR